MNLEKKEEKLSGYPTKNKSKNIYVYHEKTNSYYKILTINNIKKQIKILYKKGIFNHYKKLKFDEVVILNSTNFKDSFGNEIYENSVIRDFNNDEYGVVKFGLYQDENDTKINHYGFYIQWNNNSNTRKKEFEYWIKEGIQLVDLLVRKANSAYIFGQNNAEESNENGE